MREGTSIVKAAHFALTNNNGHHEVVGVASGGGSAREAEHVGREEAAEAVQEVDEEEGEGGAVVVEQTAVVHAHHDPGHDSAEKTRCVFYNKRCLLKFLHTTRRRFYSDKGSLLKSSYPTKEWRAEESPTRAWMSSTLLGGRRP